MITNPVKVVVWEALKINFYHSAGIDWGGVLYSYIDYASLCDIFLFDDVMMVSALKR